MSPAYLRQDIDAQPLFSDDAYNTGKHFSIKPVIVPQLTANWSSPFVRAFAEILATEYDLSPARWLAFIDGLNQVLVRSAPLSVANQVGGLLSWAPSVIVSSVATGVQVGAGVGDRMRSKTQTDHYLKQANELLFKPRGLVCRFYDTNAALKLLGLPPSSAMSVDEVLDRARAQMNGTLPPHSSVEASIRPFGDHVQPLILVDQPQQGQTYNLGRSNNSGFAAQMGDFGVKMEKWKTNRSQQKAASKLLEAQQKGNQKDISKAMSKYSSATGIQMQGGGGRSSLLGGLRNKLEGSGSTLWLVVVPLEDDQLPEPDKTQSMAPQYSRYDPPPVPVRPWKTYA